MFKNVTLCLLSAILFFSGCASLGKRSTAKDMISRQQATDELSKENERVKADTLVEIINLIKSGDLTDKTMTVEALTSACNNSPETCRLAISCMSDRDPAIRSYLEEAVVNSGKDAVPELIAGLQNTDRYVRLHCAYALSESKFADKSVIQPLIAILSDRDNEVGSAARDSLARIGKLDREAIISAIKTDNPNIRFRIAFILGRAGEGDERTIDALIGVLDDHETAIRAAAAESLVKLASAENTGADNLIARMQQMKDQPKVSLLLDALGRSGNKSKRVLEAALNCVGSPNASVRAAAAGALALLSPESENSTKAVISLLSDSDGEVRVAAAKALGFMSALRKEAVTALVGAFADRYVFVESAAQVSVSRMAQMETEHTINLLLASLGSPDKNVRASAVLALGDTGAVTEKTTQAIAKMLTDGEKDVRKAAVIALGNAGTQAKEVVGGIITCLKDSDPDVRSEAATVLQKTGYQSRDSVMKIAEALSDTDPEFRLSLEQILFKIGPAAISALVVKLDDKNTLVRMSTARVLGMIGRTVPTINDAVKKLNALLKDPDKSVKLAATIALGEIGMNNKESIMLLVENMRDKDRDIKYYSIIALGKIGPDAKEASAFLVAALKEEDNKLRSAARDALVLIGNDAVDSLAEALKETDLLVRSAAVDALDKIGSQKAKEILRNYKSR